MLIMTLTWIPKAKAGKVLNRLNMISHKHRFNKNKIQLT
uniref:Uncharacterized protein n=1 Tax=Arundo donax TaxID=35708 RepID=A0A0A9CI83_ARUDO